MKVGDKEIKFDHTAVDKYAHLFIDGTHDPELCPECIQPGTLNFNTPSTPLPEQGGDSQDDLIKFVNDPETIKRAVEGSMEKRLRVMAQSNEDGTMFEAVWNTIKGWDIQRNPGDGYAGATGTDVQAILDALEPYRKQHELDARIDELISYGREVGLLDLRVKTALDERIEKLKAEREAL